MASDLHSRIPTVPTARAALAGMAWFAMASWLQFFLSLVSFIVVARHIDPAALGAFNAAAVIIAAVDMLLGAPLTQSLEQRASLERRHIDSTFWITIFLTLLFVGAIIPTGGLLLRLVHASWGWPLLIVLALGLPFSVTAGFFSALLSRNLRFAEVGRVGIIANLLGSVASVAVIVLHGGVWSLVAADFTNRFARFCLMWWATKYRPGPPRDLSGIRDLMSFNLMTLLTYSLTYLDMALPRFLTGFVLGPASLGYLALAQRALDLLTQLTLTPLSRVMTASVARLSHDAEGLRHLIRTVYRLATSLAYPGFLAAVVLTPHLIWLIGPQWGPSVLTMQILLLVGLRTTTGTFNFGILQGTGRVGGPAIILATGLALQILLVPIGAHYGTAGVATAILIRTLGTWPIACWLVRRAVDLPIREQMKIGETPLVSALFMCAVMVGCGWLLAAQPAPVRLIACVLAGGAAYSALFLILRPEARRVAHAMLADLGRLDLGAARTRLLVALRV